MGDHRTFDAQEARVTRYWVRRSDSILHIEKWSTRGIPLTNILLRMYSVVMQGLRENVIDRSKRKTVKMGVKDGLAEYAMLPKDDRSIIPGQELLDFAFQRKQFRVKF